MPNGLGSRLGTAVAPGTGVAAAAPDARPVRINVVDPGYAVDPGVYCAPDQPHNPFPPRYSDGSRRGLALTGAD